MLWGGGFFFLVIYTWIGNILVRLAVVRILRESSEHLDLVFPAGAVIAGKAVRIHIRALMPRVILPVFHLGYRASLDWKDRQCIIEGPFVSGHNDTVSLCTPDRRGHYRGREVIVLIRDLLGFTASFVPIEKQNSLLVLPEINVPEHMIRLSGAGGDLSAVKERIHRSDELLDARKYYPGDDVRRVNWNMYAHLGDLYIRIGEEIPPPNSRVCIALDTSTPGLFDRKLLSGLMDRAVAHAAGAALFFLQRGSDVRLAFSGSGVPVACQDRETVSVFFTDAWWSDEGIARCEGGPVTTYLFSLPSCPGGRDYIRRISGNVVVLLPLLPPSPGTEKQGVVERLLFRSRTPDRSPLPGPTPVDYSLVLDADMASLPGLRRGIDVAVY